jgi:alpha-1,2-mannosyltransferase
VVAGLRYSISRTERVAALQYLFLLVVALGLAALVVEVGIGSQDLAVYRSGAAAVLHGRSLYGPRFGAELLHHLPFTYPPSAAVLATPLTLFPFSWCIVGWTTLSVMLLGACAEAAFRPVLERFGPAKWAALAVLLAAALVTSPVIDHLHNGQIELLLMTLCLLDCVAPNPRWPRGVLIGVAAAIKLVPAVFVPYLWLVGRRKAALVAGATFGLFTALGAAMAPADSWRYWSRLVFETRRIGNNAYFSNQSWHGLVLRTVHGNLESPVFVVGLAAISVVGYSNARRAAGRNELAGATIVGLMGVLLAPVSWIHSLVWAIPATGVILGPARHLTQAGAALLMGAAILVPLPLLRQSPFDSSLCLAALLAIFVLPELGTRSALVLTGT